MDATVKDTHEADNTSHKETLTCETCGKQFKHKQNLHKHKKIHSTPSSYKCAECGESFRRAGNLRSHALIHTGQVPFQCELCGKCFKKQNMLQTHLLVHAGQYFTCSECGKKFVHQGSLHTHMKIHTGEAVCHCKECGKTFKHPSSVREHMKKKHNYEQWFPPAKCENVAGSVQSPKEAPSTSSEETETFEIGSYKNGNFKVTTVSLPKSSVDSELLNKAPPKNFCFVKKLNNSGSSNVFSNRHDTQTQLETEPQDVNIIINPQNIQTVEKKKVAKPHHFYRIIAPKPTNSGIRTTQANTGNVPQKIILVRPPENHLTFETQPPNQNLGNQSEVGNVGKLHRNKNRGVQPPQLTNIKQPQNPILVTSQRKNLTIKKKPQNYFRIIHPPENIADASVKTETEQACDTLVTGESPVSLLGSPSDRDFDTLDEFPHISTDSGSDGTSWVKLKGPDVCMSVMDSTSKMDEGEGQQESKLGVLKIKEEVVDAAPETHVEVIVEEDAAHKTSQTGKQKQNHPKVAVPKVAVPKFSFRVKKKRNRPTSVARYNKRSPAAASLQSSQIDSEMRTQDDEELHQCGSCDQGFAYKSHLTQHEQMHQAEKVYVCLFCDKDFELKTALETHIKEHADRSQLP